MIKLYEYTNNHFIARCPLIMIDECILLMESLCANYGFTPSSDTYKEDLITLLTLGDKKKKKIKIFVIENGINIGIRLQFDPKEE